MGKQIVVQDISPTMAEELLKHNTANRRVNKSTVDRYADDMVAGLWASKGAPIIMKSNGVLADGQHRLLAAVKAQHTLKGAVVITVDEEDANFYDIGRHRTVGDIAQLDGDCWVFYRNNQLVGAVRFLISLTKGVNYSHQRQTITLAHVYATIKNNLEIIAPVTSIKGNTLFSGLGAGGGGALIAAYSNGYDIELMRQFMAVFKTGFPGDVARDTIPIALRNFVVRKKRTMTREAFAVEVFSKTKQALYFFEKGEPKQYLRAEDPDLTKWYGMKWIVEP